MIQLLLIFTIKGSCPSANCGKLLSNQCYSYNKKQVTIQSCDSDEICSISGFATGTSHQLQSSIGTCQTFDELVLKVPGELCNTNQECVSNMCNLGKCEGLVAGSVCQNSQECAVGLVCSEVNSGYCIEQKPLGSICYSNQECFNGGSCFNGKCFEYFSIPDGSAFDHSTNDSYLCSSGYVESSVCAQAPKNKLKPNQECLKSTDCELERDGETLYGFCYCGLNIEGKAFCKAVQGDQEFLDYKQSIQNLIKVNQPCHSSIAFSDRCLYIQGTQEIRDFLRAQYLYLYRHSLIDAKECAIEIVNPLLGDYKYAQSETQDENQSDAETVVIVVGSIIAFLLISGIILCSYYVKHKRRYQQVNQADQSNEDTVILSNSKLVKIAEGEYQSAFDIFHIEMDNAGLLLQGIPVGVIVDVYSHEQIDRFNYPIALSEDQSPATSQGSNFTSNSSRYQVPLLNVSQRFDDNSTGCNY